MTLSLEGRGLLTTCPARLHCLQSLAVHCMQGTQPPIANSDCRHGARNFSGEPTVPSMGLLLRHM